jgi:hypothetical protein
MIGLKFSIEMKLIFKVREAKNANGTKNKSTWVSNQLIPYSGGVQ